MRVLPYGALCALAMTTTAAWSQSAQAHRFVPYEPSYGVYQAPEDDESALRANYSFKYALHSSRGSGAFCESDSTSCSDLFVSYTGQFDFYVGTRPSSPVINRISNPAIHYRYYVGSGFPRWVDVGIEHRSNGQTTEVSSAADAARAQFAYDQGDHKYFDGVSRGANYISVEAKGDAAGILSKYYAKAKIYLSQDSDITWGPMAGSGTRLSDYDRFRLVAQADIFDDGELSVAWTLGDKGLRTDSWDISVLFSRSKAVTLCLKYHYGPMQTLSNYTEPRQSIGVGLDFYPYSPR